MTSNCSQMFAGPQRSSGLSLPSGRISLAAVPVLLIVAQVITADEAYQGLRPDVLMLDEPTSALDPQSTAKIEELCLELKHNVTILIVTHNVAQAGRISDQTAFMYLGDLLEFGPTERVFTVPADKRTEAYLTGVFG